MFPDYYRSAIRDTRQQGGYEAEKKDRGSNLARGLSVVSC